LKSDFKHLILLRRPEFQTSRQFARKDNAITNRSSIHLDLLLLDRLILIQGICLTVAAFVGLLTLAGWIFPAVGHLLPADWVVMRASTALAVIFSVLSLLLSWSRRSRYRLMGGRVFAVLVTLMGLVELLGYVVHLPFNLDNLLSSSLWGSQTGNMSPQSACFFIFLGFIMLLIRKRKSSAANIADLLVLLLCLLVLAIGSGHIFGAYHLSGISADTRVSPQTLLCMMLLVYVSTLRRAESGVFAILLGVGIGSKIARIACPFALLLPYLLEMGRVTLIQWGWINAPYATAITTSLTATIGFALIVILAWRIDSLEKEVRDLSLRDELTTVLNRRGFYLLAEQALRVAQRTRSSFSVLFIDMDGLKLINDSFGHDTGSTYLCEMAALLKRSFRKSDVVGRVGGDEFAVAGEGSEPAIQLAVERLQKATAEWNAQAARESDLSFSYGHVTSDPGHDESLSELLEKADKAMYRTKRKKKQMRDSDPDRPAYLA